MNFKINKKREYKRFVFPCETKIKKNVSYCCFIVFKDKKLLFATRSHSFYCSYIYVTLSKKTELTQYHINKILTCIKNLNLVEFLDFIMALIYQGIIKAQDYFSWKELDTLIHLDQSCRVNIFKNSNMKYMLEENTELLFEIKKIIHNFRNWYFDNKKTDDIEFDAGYTIVLPGGKKELGESCKETIIREVMEEIGLDINADEVSFLSNNLKFTNFKSNIIIPPIIDCFTKDKVLNHIYNDKIFILKIDRDFNDVVKNFKPTTEIVSVISVHINIDYDNMNTESLKKIFNAYKNTY